MDTEPVGFSIAIAQHVTEGLQRPGLSEMLAGHAKLLGLPDGGEDLPLLLAQTRRDVGALLTFDPVYLRDTHGKSTVLEQECGHQTEEVAEQPSRGADDSINMIPQEPLRIPVRGAPGQHPAPQINALPAIGAVALAHLDIEDGPDLPVPTKRFRID